MRLVTTIEIQKLLAVDKQRCWAISREPSRFGLDPKTIVRIGRSVRWNLTLVEEWVAAGGSVNGSERQGATTQATAAAS